MKVHYLSDRYTVKMSMGGLSTDSAKRRKMWDEDIRVYSSNGFRFPTLTKIQKILRKVPQYVVAKLLTPTVSFFFPKIKRIFKELKE